MVSRVWEALAAATRSVFPRLRPLRRALVLA